VARVFVAMSGGVDSSVSAALLLEQGHDVTGVTMQLWPSTDESGGCCSESAIRDAKRVCDLLGIPHYTLNYRDTFEREVVTPFADEYAAGRTPNPCIRCNDRLKFSDLLAKVSAQGAEYLATGHYARILRDSAKRPMLARGVDPGKDQSYFLYRLTAAQLAHVLFPVGELHKPEVRSFAERLGLPVASKSDSQEICFSAGDDHAGVVAARRPEAMRPGEIVDASGTVVGTHTGLAGYTVGQRKGLGVGGSPAPLFVIGLDAERNRVIVGPRDALRVTEVTAGDLVWHGGEVEPVRAAVRYRMEPRPAVVRVSGDRLTAQFDEPLEGVAPGQSLVCYRGDVVIGGGVIACAS
jgi:tRNA-specific 2-thiouridylase